MNKILYMLIGPKGAGKTYIGKFVNRHTDIKFIQVELIWLDLQSGEDGWKKVGQAIDRAFQTHDRVMIESLGAGEGFTRLYTALKQKYPTKMIRVSADLEVCLERVKQRDSAEQLTISAEKVEAYNRIAAKVNFDWALELNNTDPLSDAAILAAIQSL